MSVSATLDLAMELIRRPSVTPADAGCQDLIGARLEAAGFRVEHFDGGGVRNLWARRGTEPPLFAFAGHTDVVPPGPVERWTHPPFEPAVDGGWLYGRGAADMKGSVAAMVTALEALAHGHSVRGSVALLLTSDEEGVAVDGTRRAVAALSARGEHMDWCLVGEPSSSDVLGDIVRIGRRGTLTGHLTVRGVQGHVAYPQRADNPIHRFAPALMELCAARWDDGDDHFPPTSLQLSNLSAGTGADNVIPGHLTAVFNLRYGPSSTADGLRAAVGALLARHGLDFDIQWHHGGAPFITAEGPLLTAVEEAVHHATGHTPRRSTGGGTSDARFIAPTGAQVVELGPCNATIHQVDERVAVAELDTLADIYRALMTRLLGDGATPA